MPVGELWGLYHLTGLLTGNGTHHIFYRSPPSLGNSRIASYRIASISCFHLQLSKVGQLAPSSTTLPRSGAKHKLWLLLPKIQSSETQNPFSLNLFSLLGESKLYLEIQKLSIDSSFSFHFCTDSPPLRAVNTESSLPPGWGERKGTRVFQG